jgi:hypothetical protein
MSDTIINITPKTSPMNIKYAKNYHGFSDCNPNSCKYLFELIIRGDKIGIKYFRKLEDNKYAHMIRLNDMIQLNDISSYNASLSIFPSDNDMTFELNGIINSDTTSSTQRSSNMYIEFTQNDMGNTICSCFYTGMDMNKVFASPPL